MSQAATHDEIESILFFTDPNSGNLIAIDKADPADVSRHKLAALKYYNLLVAAPILYQCLTRKFEELQSFIDFFESLDITNNEALDNHISYLIGMQNDILAMQRVAQIGIKDFVKTMRGDK